MVFQSQHGLAESNFGNSTDSVCSFDKFWNTCYMWYALEYISALWSS
jgi:hypothetical protein